MKLTDDIIIQEDIEKICEAEYIPWNLLKNKSILITGATGLIGYQTVLALLYADKAKNLGITVYAVVRNEQKAKKMFSLALSNNLKFIVQDILEPFNITDKIDYIIHGASMTSSKDFIDYPVETIKTALQGTENILNFAKDNGIEGMVYLSSLEVYGVVDFSVKKVPENFYGSLDPMSVRSSYSESKRMVECLCASYASEYNLPIKVVRLCQTFGPGVSYQDNRVFAQFARSVIERKDIILKTDGSTERNYCYIRDTVTGILTVLLNGNKGDVYNIANKNTLITIRKMAEMLINQYPQSGSSLVFDIADDVIKLGYNPKIVMNLDTEKVESLGWSAQVDLPDMFTRMIASMTASENK